MKNYTEISVKKSILESIACDICGKTFDKEKDALEIEEMIFIKKSCGYDSIFGDNSTVKLDMCQHCFQEKLGEFIRIKELK